MSGIWSETEDGWRPLPSEAFARESDLHDLVERGPSMLPLPGGPNLVVLGREVRCGSGWADIIAVDAETGLPVIVEIKLASNTDRRQVLTQVLGYAAALRRLDLEGLDALLASHLAKLEASSVADAVATASQDPSFDVKEFTVRLEEALRQGTLRCVVVIDAAPNDLVELVGYLQDVTNDRLSIDMVTVSAYRVGNTRVLVPQLVEPARLPASDRVTAVATARPAGEATITRGDDVFAAALDAAPEDQQPLLRRLLRWAQELEADGLAVLYSSTGKGRWVLNPRLPGQQRGLVTVWNANGAFLSPYRLVLEREAPATLVRLDAAYPGQIRQGNYLRAEYDEELLRLLRTAYEEATPGVPIEGR